MNAKIVRVPPEQPMTIAKAVSEYLGGNYVYYFTSETVAILSRLGMDTYGFIYIGRVSQKPKFISGSPTEAIQTAMNENYSRDLFVTDDLKALLK